MTNPAGAREVLHRRPRVARRRPLAVRAVRGPRGQRHSVMVLPAADLAQDPGLDSARPDLMIRPCAARCRDGMDRVAG
jgi:hypothetical protein